MVGVLKEYIPIYKKANVVSLSELISEYKLIE